MYLDMIKQVFSNCHFHKTFKRTTSMFKTVVVSVVVTVVLLTVYFHSLENEDPSKDIDCYDLDIKGLPYIESTLVKKGKAIFFHETSCKSYVNGKIVITSRQACAVESAARQNPHFEIILLYSSPGMFRYEDSESDRFLQALLTYDNFKMRRLDLRNYVRNTLIEDLFKNKKIGESTYPQIHTSDVLRLLTLWKYGGIYLDLDVIVLKSLEHLAPNFAGSQSRNVVASGVLSFSHKGAGHILITQLLRDLKHNFDGESWADSGPGVVTRLAKRICAAEDASDMVDASCVGDFRVYPPAAFYPIHWKNWTIYFDSSIGANMSHLDDIFKDSYVAHTWNKLSHKRKIPVGENVPYSILAQNHCPRVFSECLEFF